MSGDQVLVVEDDMRMRELLAEVLFEQGLQVTVADDGLEALNYLQEQSFALVLTDLKMPGVDGLGVLEAAKGRDRELPVILITAHGTVQTALAAMRQGAYDFIEKPFDPEVLILTVSRALRHFCLVQRNRELDQAIQEMQDSQLIGSGQAMQKLKLLIRRLAPLDVTMLIQGETGTGKELAATLIHRYSQRCAGRFLPVNCAALPEALLESELFGHEKGAFTGASQAKQGLVEAADKGTLFLDEINSMPMSFQVKLLRFLQDRTYMRLGGSKLRSADVRIIAAGNTDLRQEVEAGRFREDLFYRLNVMPLEIPPLRERREDIAELTYFFLRKVSRIYEKNVSRVSRKALSQLTAYDWPGNVRELENVITGAVILAEGESLESVSLPERDLPPQTASKQNRIPLGPLRDMEYEMIRQALETTHGNRAAAARILDIDPSTLWRKIKRLDIPSK